VSETDRTKEELAKAGAAVAAAGVSIAAAPTALGAAAGLSGALGAVYSAWQAWQDDKVRRLLREAYFENCADEAFGAYIAGLLKDARTKRVFLESIRAALDSSANEVLSALAAVLREYERTGKEPDAQFRGLCRVLQELAPDEYASMRGLFGTASADPKLLETSSVSFVRAVDPVAKTEEVIAARAAAENTLYFRRIEACDPRHLPRLNHLFYVHGFGNALGWSAVTLTGKDVFDEVRFEPEVIRWVTRFLVK
jgi:hypothetical protein